MQCMRVCGLLSVLLLMADAVIAQQELLDEPRLIEQIRFSPPTNASIRLTSGVRRTGKIVSISSESMVYQVGRDNKEVTIEIDQIDRVNTLDNEFTWEPEDEDFERLKVKARRISYLNVETVETYQPPPDRPVPADPPSTDPPPPPDNPNPQPPTTPEPQPEMRPENISAGPEQASPPETTETPAERSDDGIPDTEPQPGELILFCSNCNGRLPLSIRNGEKCPHCGLVFWNTTSSGGGARPRPAGNTGNAGGEHAAYPTVAGNPGGGDAAVGTAPEDQPSEGGAQVVARGTGLGDIPTWMKVGFFVCVLVVGWLILQRR